jgi:hypothetical protein
MFYKFTHYIHSVVVQEFLSGRACCLNQYHYESFIPGIVLIGPGVCEKWIEMLKVYR